MTKSTKKKWTVFFLVKSLYSQEMKDLIAMLNEMKDVRFEPHIHVLLGINFDKRNYKALASLDSSLVKKYSDHQFTTMFFRFSTHSPMEQNELIFVDEKVDFDITHIADLTEYFNKSIFAFYQAEKYLLFTWDHGNCYGIFQGVGRGGEDISKMSGVPILTMHELKVALANVFVDNKVDLMIMLNCNMQMFDTAFALRDQVKYLVACQTDMDSDHYQYRDIFNTLAKFPDISGELLARMVIIHTKIRTLSIDEDVSISACDLSVVRQIVPLLDQLADELKQVIGEGSICWIKDKFEAAEFVERSEKFIDFLSLLYQLKESDKKEIQLIINKLIPIFHAMVIEFFTKHNATSIAEYKCHFGVSTITPFIIPLKNEVFPALERFIEYTEFRTQTRWGKTMSEIAKINFSC